MLAFIAGSSAVALEEQKIQVPTPATPQDDAVKLGVQDAPATKANTGGTEVRIPGLGKLGTLPKMDFGLELLYGASDGAFKAAPDPVPENIDPQQDLTIRGSLKHSF